MVAALTATLLGTAGFALDAGLYYVGNRDLRAATEAAALAAAMDPRDGLNRARNYLARNGRDPSVLQSIQIGRYCPDISLRPEDRFDPGMTRCPGNGQENAVRLHTSAPSRQFLSQLLGPLNPIPPLAATASAARIDEAGIEATSGILTVTNSLVNSVNNLLGALLGIQLVLTTADVEALMGGNVDAGLFFDKLADRIGETGTYGDLAKRRVKLGDIMAAARDSAGDPRTERVLGL
ncbi:MAG TPA: pilus assembly protein TadG-related protein, partial [Sphingobium sp.]|nr:pilus assembly protein TadG-related protein [Sphingobium sp.]